LTARSLSHQGEANHPARTDLIETIVKDIIGIDDMIPPLAPTPRQDMFRYR